MTCKHWFEGMVARSETSCPFCEVERLRGLILRASAELETVDYENDPPMRVVALIDELRAVNRSALLTPNVQIEAADAALSRQVASNAGLGDDDAK